jgi:cytosine/uracil/thiamine/allantoin permease
VAQLHFFWAGGWFFGLAIALGAYSIFMRHNSSRLDAAAVAAITDESTATRTSGALSLGEARA